MDELKTKLTVTEIPPEEVFSPENLERRNDIYMVYKNMNKVYFLKPLSGTNVGQVVKAIDEDKAAFLLIEEKEIPEPDPGPDPEPETNGGTV